MTENRNEDYVLVWLGLKCRLADDMEAEEVRRRSHPLGG